MKTKFLSRLEKKIEEFVEENFDDWSEECFSDEYYHEELVEQMALSASQVMDSAFMAQKFMKEQNKGTS